MRIHCIALLIAGALATPAFAQDEPAPPPPPPSNSGFRIEGLVGWDHTEILDDDEGGFLYGVGIGYDFQTGRAVLSIEAEANESTNNGCLTGIVNANDRLCVIRGATSTSAAGPGSWSAATCCCSARPATPTPATSTEYDDATAGIQRRVGYTISTASGSAPAPSSGSAATPISGPRRAIPIMRAAATAARSWPRSASASERRGRAASGGARPPSVANRPRKTSFSCGSCNLGHRWTLSRRSIAGTCKNGVE